MLRKLPDGTENLAKIINDIHFVSAEVVENKKK